MTLLCHSTRFNWPCWARALGVLAACLIVSTVSADQTRGSSGSRSVGGTAVRLPVPPPAPPSASPRALEQYRGHLEGYKGQLEQYRQDVEGAREQGAVDLPKYRQDLSPYYDGIQRYQEGIKTYKESTGSDTGRAAPTYRLDPKVARERAAAVSTRMTTVQGQTLTKLAQMQPVPLPPSAPRIGTVYDVRQVQSILGDAKRQALVELDGPDLEPLRLYVEKRFPTGEQLPVQRYEWNPGGLVSADSVRSVSSDVTRFYDSLKTLKAIAVDLKVSSRPTEAAVTVTAITKKVTATTDSTMNLFRGLYSYTILKPGFKVVTGELDLVNDSRGLDCLLHQDGQPDGPTPCNRR
jgi:hypothetical protein